MRRVAIALVTGVVAGAVRWTVPRYLEWREDNRTVSGTIQATHQDPETGVWLVAVVNKKSDVIHVVWRDRSVRPRQGDQVILYTPIDPTGHVRGCKVRKAPGQPMRVAWMLSRTEWQREEQGRRDEEDAMHRSALEEAQRLCEERRPHLREEFRKWIEDVSRPDTAMDELEAVRQCELAEVLIAAAHDQTALETLYRDRTRSTNLYRWSERVGASLDAKRSPVRMPLAEYPEDMEPSFALAGRFVPPAVLAGDSPDSRFDLMQDVVADEHGALHVVNPAKFQGASGIKSVLVVHGHSSPSEEELVRRHVARLEAEKRSVTDEDRTPNRTVHVYMCDTTGQRILIAAGSEGRGQGTRITERAQVFAGALGVEVSLKSE